MSSAREQILARVRAAVGDVTTPLGARGETPRVEQAAASRADTIELFVDNVVDYKATVVRVKPGDEGAAIGAALRTAPSVVVPAGLPAAWRDGWPSELRVVADEGLAHEHLDAIAAVVTGSALGIATTGTIVLDHGPDQGRRALSLVPDLHVCVVRAEQVVHDVPESVARLRSAVLPPTAADGRMPRPLTWISGPSATSDIELDRVEGVHGPRTLHVILVEG